MLKKLLQDLEKGAQSLKESALSVDPRAKAEEVARAAGGGMAEVVKFVKEKADAARPTAQAASQAAREGFEASRAPAEPDSDGFDESALGVGGGCGDYAAYGDPERFGEAERAGSKSKTEQAARAAGKGAGVAFKFIQERVEIARPSMERAATALAQGAEDLARAAREGFDRRMSQGEEGERAPEENQAANDVASAGEFDSGAAEKTGERSTASKSGPSM